MTRKTLKTWAIGFVGILLLAGLCVSLIELFDNRRPLVPPPDRVTSFVEMLDLSDLVTTATPPNVELKRVAQGSGRGTGFKYGRDPSVLFDSATSNKSIEFEMTCDAELRASLLLRLSEAMTVSLREWNSNIQIGRLASPDGSTDVEGFVLEYRVEGQTGDYKGAIEVAVKQVPRELMRPSETGNVVHSLAIVSNESRWGHE